MTWAAIGAAAVSTAGSMYMQSKAGDGAGGGLDLSGEYDDANYIFQKNKDFLDTAWENSQDIAADINNLAGGIFTDYIKPTADYTRDWAQEDRKLFDSSFRKLDAEFARKAGEYASDAEIKKQRAMAGQDTAAAMDAARESNERDLRRQGVLTGDPSQPGSKLENLMAEMQTAQAQAQAMNQAADLTKARGMQYMQQASGIGQNYANQAQQGSVNSANIANSGTAGMINAANVGLNAQQAAVPYLSSANQNVAMRGDMGIATGQMAENARQFDRAGDLAGAAGLGNFAGGLGETMFNSNKGGGDKGGGTPKTSSPTKVYKAADGGHISAPGGPEDDQGLMRLSNGEYVIPADVVNNLGASILDKFVAKSTGEPAPSKKQALPIPEGM
mgnify:FL=1